MSSNPYTHVRLILHNGGFMTRYEIRVSTFVQFDENPGRRAVTGELPQKQAEDRAKEIARSERARTGAPKWK